MQWEFELLMAPPELPLTEGPVWDGECLYFTHIIASRIMRYDCESRVITTWRKETNRTNGLAFDSKGQLFGCCAGGRSIVRFDPDGNVVILADRLDGKRLNTPNDLAIDDRGRIWFTNPWSGSVAAEEQRELDHASVLRLDPQVDGRHNVTRATFDTTLFHALGEDRSLGQCRHGIRRYASCL
jgi:gluconolactonase